jgi:hypothetical protein
MPTFKIQYADKPWNRGHLYHRFVEVPAGYNSSEEKATRWLRAARLINDDETIVGYTADNKTEVTNQPGD